MPHMKKFVLILTFLAATLLCTTVAFAGPRCDACGGSTTLAGSGSWCHWDCEACGYRTSRNHNPNSYNSGLSPDSCSGHCRWCGAAAAWSSHTFTNWVSNGDATCTSDGTETAKCSNAQCSASTTRTATGSAPGHNYTVKSTVATCTDYGYDTYTCTRCGDSYTQQTTRPNGHSYGQWISNGDGTHTAKCTGIRCSNTATVPCSTTTCVIGGKELTLCPICGVITSESGAVDLDTSSYVSAKAMNGDRLPGRLMVLVDAAPMDVEMTTDAFYMFITSFQYNGKTKEYDGPVEITIDLNEHPFSMPDSIFFDMPPSMLKARAFKIVRVEYGIVDGRVSEVWHEMPFTLKDGILTFEADKMGTFLMVLNIMEAPSVG